MCSVLFYATHMHTNTKTHKDTYEYIMHASLSSASMHDHLHRNVYLIPHLTRNTLTLGPPGPRCHRDPRSQGVDYVLPRRNWPVAAAHTLNTSAVKLVQERLKSVVRYNGRRWGGHG